MANFFWRRMKDNLKDIFTILNSNSIKIDSCDFDLVDIDNLLALRPQ